MAASQPEIPLSYSQEQLWFIDGFHDGFPAHNLAYLIRLRGPLDVAALRRALDAVVARHEPLRTRLVTGAGGRPVQVIDPPGPVDTDHHDLSGLAPSAAASRLAEIAAASAVRPFRLERDWPLRGVWITLPSDEHALIVVAHQTAFDGASLAVLQHDLAALYAAAAATPDSTAAHPQPAHPQPAHPQPAHPQPADPTVAPDAALAPLPLTFAGYAADERARLTGQTLADLEAYWRATLAGEPSSQFPADRPRPLLANHQGVTQASTISPAVDNRLRELAAARGATLPQVLMAALQVLLYRYTSQRDIVTGVLDGGRDQGRPELAPMIGLLAGPLPVRGDLSGDPSFIQFLDRLRGGWEEAARHAGLPFARIVEALNLERDPGRFPVFQTGLSYAELPAEVEAAGVRFGCEPLPVAASRYDISFAVRPAGGEGGLLVEATYTPALFDPATAGRLLGNFAVLLGGIAADPDARLSALPIMTEAELHDELIAWNDTAKPFPVMCIHQGFEAQAKRAPAAIAAQYENEQISYGELNRQANRIARALREHGVGPEVLAGVCLPTGIRRLAALLGVWKAGGGYVPLDQALPADRLAFLIGDTGMTVVIADETSVAAVPDAGATVLSLDELAPRLAELDDANLDGGAQPQNVAYVIYTSGSTGQPKGVVVEHRQALNFLQGMIGAWHIEPSSALLGFAAYTFDVSVMDMFMPLLAGAKVVLAPAQTLHSPPRLAELIRTSKVTFACLPPAVLRLLTGEEFPDLRTLLSSGEELRSDLLQAWLRDGLEIYNGYGPTEASIGSTFMKLEPTTPLPPPIGRPKPNYQAYVLDEFLNPVPVGVTGELHVGGPGVARGYLNRPELTRERFIPDPFIAGQRLYKTGDLVRRRPDGTIEFAGRIDNQVKIRGLRVEPGEIEAAMADHPQVTQTVVIVVTDASGERQLAGYYRAEGGLDAGELRAHLSGTLPGYMIPTYLTPVGEFPLNAHGKIDRAALPAPEAASSAAQRVPPRTLIETVLVDMYATVLGTEQVGATDSFFDAGGNSLQAMQLITRLRADLDVDLDVAAVFVTPTARQLAAVLRDEHGFDDEELGPDGIARLTQEELADGLTQAVLTETGHAH